MSIQSLLGTDRVRLVPSRLARTRTFIALLALGLAGSALVPPRAVAQDRAMIVIHSFRPTLVDASIALGQTLSANGMVVDLRDPFFGDDVGDLADYTCVWDLRVDDALQAIDEARFQDHLLAGRGLYLSGEHGSFSFRNNSVAAFLSSNGGGPIAMSPIPPPGLTPVDNLEPTNPAHPITGDCLNPVTEVDYSGIGSGSFTNFGTGTWLSGSPVSGGAAAFDPGSLASVPDAHVVVGLDVNYLSAGFAGTLDFQVLNPLIPTQNRQFVQNIAAYLCGFARPEGAKDPRNHGYWHRYCLGSDTIDPGRNGGGRGPGPSRDAASLPANLLVATDAIMAAHGVTTCAALDDGPFSEPRVAALRELATLHLNLQSGYLDCSALVELHPVNDTPGLRVGDALALMEAALAGTDDDALRDAAWIGEHVNNGEAILR
jgi:hypothetical protein